MPRSCTFLAYHPDAPPIHGSHRQWEPPSTMDDESGDDLLSFDVGGLISKTAAEQETRCVAACFKTLGLFGRTGRQAGKAGTSVRSTNGGTPLLDRHAQPAPEGGAGGEGGEGAASGCCPAPPEGGAGGRRGGCGCGCVCGRGGRFQARLGDAGRKCWGAVSVFD